VPFPSGLLRSARNDVSETNRVFRCSLKWIFMIGFNHVHPINHIKITVQIGFNHVHPINHIKITVQISLTLSPSHAPHTQILSPQYPAQPNDTNKPYCFEPFFRLLSHPMKHQGR